MYDDRVLNEAKLNKRARIDTVGERERRNGARRKIGSWEKIEKRFQSDEAAGLYCLPRKRVA